ncbi:MAG: hypothetical protein KZQ87_17025 [Candidatus Thiodiazotropha sp. (ex Cardiolucina cf. quadrata)]|nr:hypothetical protein [Candidatus Thiodiazotropha sp. (ex Cardiolucina cf. quadrata)]
MARRVSEIAIAKRSGKAAENGFELCSVGLKDVILPGEMKEILNSLLRRKHSTPTAGTTMRCSCCGLH